MELKSYQHKVINDLELYLEYLQKYRNTAKAFNQFWEDRIGPYNPIDGKGMQPYRNNIPNAVHVCVKVPTAGGKTFIAVNALHNIFQSFNPSKPKAVIWLVPWSNLLDQTVLNLSNPDHPYRQKLNSLFNHRVEVYEKKDLLQGSNFNPTVVQDQLTIIVMSFASLRARNKEDRKVYQENGQLAPFATQYSDQEHILEDTDETALINVIRSLNPVVVVDESHNAESDLSVDMFKALNPSFILDLSATPKQNSNIISLVPAIELKKEHMVKLPVIIYNHHDKSEVINSALHLQHKLEILAKEEFKVSGNYIRPIVLFQAQPKTSDDNTTFEKLKEQLLKLQIPEEQIKIKTANINELKGVDLSSKDCTVRYIITINALKEGWDCPFAYILASLADKSSAVDVEQILGRVLRQPYVMKHKAPLLNVSYVLTASAKFNETLQNIVKSLQSSGFSEKDYREKDKMPDEEKKATKVDPLELALFPEQQPEESTEEEIDKDKISFKPGEESQPAATGTVDEIESMAIEQNKEMESQIQQQQSKSDDDNIFLEMEDKVKRYRMREAPATLAKEISLPQFFLKIPPGGLFNEDTVLLSQESLLENFKLSKYDTLIDFDQISSDLYKVDLQEVKKDEYTPTFTKLENPNIKDPIVEYILAKPMESQISDIAHQLVQLVGDMYPIADQEISIFVKRILENLNPEQLRDILVRKWSYATKIKDRIRFHADTHAEGIFDDKVTIGSIKTTPNWKFPEILVPGTSGPSISNSLYEKEGKMNNFEASVITDISSMSNIAFWHRNLGRGKGFSINGYKSNHYPDFIIATKSDKIIILETKGDDRDNSDSEAKCSLGNKWAELAGPGYSYFMVFDKKSVAGAYTLDKAKELIRQM